ncbi:MAG: hypothetical protein GY811_09375 [Myxococcales bacterium]|nr:hypothetical protein [Myxococcales bacterium]
MKLVSIAVGTSHLFDSGRDIVTSNRISAANFDNRLKEGAARRVGAHLFTAHGLPVHLERDFNFAILGHSGSKALQSLYLDLLVMGAVESRQGSEGAISDLALVESNEGGDIKLPGGLFVKNSPLTRHAREES